MTDSLHLAGHAGALELLAPLGVLDDLALALPGVTAGLGERDRMRETVRRLEPLDWRESVRLDIDGEEAEELQNDRRLHGWKRCAADAGAPTDVALEVAGRDPRRNLLKLRFAVVRGTTAAGVLVLLDPTAVDRWHANLDGLYAPLFDGVPILLVAA